MFDGDITPFFTRNVEITAGEAATRNLHKRSRQLDFNPASADSTRVNNGTAAGPGVRKAMAFLNLHFGVLFPIDVAIMKCTRKKRSLLMQGETVSVRAMMQIGLAAVHHDNPIVRHACCAFYAMGLGAIRLDQLNRTCILGEHPRLGASNPTRIWIKTAPAVRVIFPWSVSTVARGSTVCSPPRPTSQ